MNRRITLTLLVAVLALATMACELSGILVENNVVSGERGSGNVVEETRPISGVTDVDLATIGNVIIEIGEKESLRIEAEDNLMKYFETDMRGETLKISTNPSTVNLRPTKPVYFFLTVKDLERVSISGSGDIQVPDLESGQFNVDIGGSGDINMGDLLADRLEINIGGSGDVSTGRVIVPSLRVKINGSGDITLMELKADDLSLNVNGSGNLRINDGNVGEQDIDINGSGNFQAEDLASKVTNINIGGSGDITVWVVDTLDVRIMGSGNVRYYGRPTVSSTGNGSGDITNLGDK
ncbi:MAG: head GIN domain-containing protein [Anaerolineales bacterium]